MKLKLFRLSRRYGAALGRHLKQPSPASLLGAARLGRQSLAVGLGTLDLARIHEEAVSGLASRGGSARARSARAKEAARFFEEANLPIEETHRAARQAQVDLRLARAALSRRTRELAASDRQVRQGAARCQVMEDACAKGGARHGEGLEESLQLQKHLRQLTHRVMAAQENERTKISRELQDEIVQTLVGINVRLLSLKQRAQTNTKGLKHQIASTQRLVVQSARSVRRLANELELPTSALRPPARLGVASRA